MPTFNQYVLCTIRKVTLFWFYVCFLIFHIFCSFWVMGVFVKTLSFDFLLSRENYKLRKESCDKIFCFSSNPAQIGLKLKLIPCIFLSQIIFWLYVVKLVANWERKWKIAQKCHFSRQNIFFYWTVLAYFLGYTWFEKCILFNMSSTKCH